MNVYTQFNGWNIIPMPSTPSLRQVNFTANDSVGQTQSPFTMSSQVQAWPGADWWEAEVSLPPMTRAKAAAWIAWLLALRGKANVFQLGDPLGVYPQGTFTGSLPLVNGAQLPTATVLSVRGMTPNLVNALMPGDYLQVGYRLHMVAGPSPVSTDSNGTAQIEIWPSLRDPLTDGTTVYIGGSTGLWRLSENKRVWSQNEVRLFGISFKAIEAR